MRKTGEGFFVHIGRINIRPKLIILYFVVGIIPCLLISLFLSSNTRGTIIKQRAEILSLDNRRIRDTLVMITNQCIRISEPILFDAHTKRLITTVYTGAQDVSDAYRTYSLLNNMLIYYPALSGIQIYVTNETMLTRGSFVVADETIRSSNWFREAVNSKGEYFWMTNPGIDHLGGLKLVRKIPLVNDDVHAVMVISVSDDNLNLLIGNGKPLYALHFNETEQFYHTALSPLALPPDSFKGTENIYDIVLGRRKALVCTSSITLFNSKDTIQITSVDTLAYSDAGDTMRVMMLPVLAVLLVPLLLIIWYTSDFSNRLYVVRDQMRSIAEGKLQSISALKGNDELAELFDDMQRTIRKMQELNEEVYEREVAQQKLISYQKAIEFKMLSSQINPHFLLNTLESIRMKAVLLDQEEIANIMERLGALMRYVLNANVHMVTLDSEIENIYHYLEIQRFRFGPRLNYTIRVAEDIDAGKYMLLPLLLQPIVENALLHGIERQIEGGWVMVNIWHEDHYLLISVIDSGAGVDECARIRLVERMENPREMSHEGIGLSNTHQRMRLQYGEAYGIELYSKPNEGTKVILRLPWEVT